MGQKSNVKIKQAGIVYWLGGKTGMYTKRRADARVYASRAAAKRDADAAAKLLAYLDGRRPKALVLVVPASTTEGDE